MKWSDVSKTLGGILLAIALFFGGGFLLAQVLIAQFTALPPKPIFPNDKPSPQAKPAATGDKSAAPPPVANSPSPAASPTTASPSPTPSPSPSPTATPSPAPTGATGTPARITLDQGLNIRSGPSRDAERVGGVDYNQRVILLEESPDKEWQKVRVEGTNVEGWIKAGHTERLN